MKSWILGIVGLSCILGSLSLSAIGQQATKPDQEKSVTKRSFKELKFKIEWTGGYKGKEATSSESAILCAAAGETSMTNNPVNNGETYRKAIIHPELQPDGSYIVDLLVSESSRVQDYQRMSTPVKLKWGQTKVVQTRYMKDASRDYEYQTKLSLGLD